MFGIALALETILQAVHNLGLRMLAPSPFHPKVDILLQDEALISQKGMPRQSLTGRMASVEGSCLFRQCLVPEFATPFTGIEPSRECLSVPEVQSFCQPDVWNR